MIDLLPERDRDRVRNRLRAAWSLTDADLAKQRLQLLASELNRTWPDAAASLREGMTETLTLTRLGITGQLAKTLSSTNPAESMIEIVRHTQRNVKRWQDGDYRLIVNQGSPSKFHDDSECAQTVGGDRV